MANAERTRLLLARIRTDAQRSAARRKMQGLDRKAAGIMETRGWSDADVDKMLTSDKVLRGIARDMGRCG